MGPILSHEPLKAENFLRWDSEGRWSGWKVRETQGVRGVPSPQGAVGTVWRHFQWSLLTGIWQVEAKGAAKRPTMHRTAPQTNHPALLSAVLKVRNSV